MLHLDWPGFGFFGMVTSPVILTLLVLQPRQSATHHLETLAASMSCAIKAHWEIQQERLRQVPTEGRCRDWPTCWRIAEEDNAWTTQQLRALSSIVDLTEMCAMLDRQADAGGVMMVLEAYDLIYRDALQVAAGNWLAGDRLLAVTHSNAWCRLPTLVNAPIVNKVEQYCCDNQTDPHSFTTLGPVHAAHTYLHYTKHTVGAWAAGKFGASAASIISGGRLERVASLHDSVASQYLHGIVWHSMLKQLALNYSMTSVRGFAIDVCCAACSGPGCNAECATTIEGDWYHACFHGLGHGSMLLAQAAVDTRFNAYSACTPVPWLSLGADAKTLSQATASCEAATAGRHAPNRKHCFTGLYMSYFQNLNPVRSEWDAACKHAACKAACIIKCRQFASDIFDPVPIIFTWPSRLVCYGDRSLSKDVAFALDDRITVYARHSYGQPAAASVFTAEYEDTLFQALGQGPETIAEWCYQ